jgi:membrane-bound lytic murein transglycosylase D
MQKKFLYMLVAIISLGLSGSAGFAQNGAGKQYQQMSRAERSAFVATEARRIAKEISGRDYEFTPAFEEDIQQAVNSYTRRLESSAKRDLRVTLDRGRTNAPVLSAAFRTHNLSPLFGLYIPFIESEFLNIESPNMMGAIGMFQFLPKTGENYGLSPQDLLDIAKSADAAARYLNDSMNTFKSDSMKEVLALLAYNRGDQRTLRDLKLLGNDGNKQCSICALNADRGKLDDTFRSESAFYVPRFFAAAIIGENPTAFGIQMQPLSTY